MFVGCFNVLPGGEFPGQSTGVRPYTITNAFQKLKGDDIANGGFYRYLMPS